MEVKTKLSIGDPMYVIKQGKHTTVVDCISCDGTGKIQLKSGKNFTCPECSGRGYLSEEKSNGWHLYDDRNIDPIFHMCGRPVGRIEIAIKQATKKNELETTVRYYPHGYGNFFFEENVFKSEEEAWEECSRRNALLDEENERKGV